MTASVAVVVSGTVIAAAITWAPGAQGAPAQACRSGERQVSSSASEKLCQAVFTANGYFEPQEGVELVDVLLVGAGGSGGAGTAAGTADSATDKAANGGNGGEVLVVQDVDITTGFSLGANGISVTVGQGVQGANGQASLFGLASDAGAVTALGGTRGLNSSENSSVMSSGGKGGNGASPTNDPTGSNGGNGVLPNSGLFTGWNGSGEPNYIPTVLGGGGGGGSGWNGTATVSGGTGGTGGGGGGSANDNAIAANVDSNRGGGGGGAGRRSTTAMAGGSGVVVVRYKILVRPQITTVQLAVSGALQTISPSNPVRSGLRVVVSGSNLFGTSVDFGGTSVTPTGGPTQFSFSAPSLSTSGQVPITVTNPLNGTSATWQVDYDAGGGGSGGGGNSGGGGSSDGDSGGGSSSGGSSSGGGSASAAETTPAPAANSTPSSPSLDPVSLGNPPAPGAAEASVGGKPVVATTAPTPPTTGAGGANAGATAPRGVVSNGATVTGTGFSASVAGPTAAGALSGNAVRLPGNAPVSVGASGFSAGSDVKIYLMVPGQPNVLLGTATTNADGTFASSITMPKSATPGSGVIQINGVTGSNERLTVSMGVEVLPAVAPQPKSDGALPDLAPGQSLALTSAGTPEKMVVTKPASGGLRFTLGSTSAFIAGEADGATQPLNSKGQVVIERQGTAGVSGRGFAPNTQVAIWAFSTPTFLGFVQTDAKGEYRASLPLPAALALGDHTLQSNGTASSGRPISVAAGILVVDRTKSAAAGKPATAKAQVAFDRMSATVDASGRKALAALATKVKGKQPSTVVVGYVQKSGDTSNDASLSLARAKSVAAALRAAGLTGPIEVKGLGVRDAVNGAARTVIATVTYRT